MVMEKLTAEFTRIIRRRFSAGILVFSILNVWFLNILYIMNVLNMDLYGIVVFIVDFFFRIGVYMKIKRCNAFS